MKLGRKLAEGDMGTNTGHEAEADAGYQQANKLVKQEEEEEEHGVTSAPSALPQVLATAVVTVSQLNVGAIFAFPGVTLPSLVNPDSGQLHFTTANAALFGSVVYLGAMLGSFVVGLPMVRLGQRVTLLLGLPLALVTWLVFFFSSSVWLILVTRFIQGVALSFISNSSSTYVAELSHSYIRGRLMASLDLFRQLGSFFVFCMGISLSWRQVALVSGLINTILPFIGLLFLPDSPRWLATRGRTDDAYKALIFYRGKKYNSRKELNHITDQLQTVSLTDKTKGPIDQLRQLSDPVILRFVIIMSVMMFLIHFNGMSVIPAYIVLIMEEAHIPINPYVAAMVLGGVKVAGTLFYMVVVDRIKRKTLFTGTALMSALGMAILGGYFLDKTHGQHLQTQNWLPVAMMAIYAFFSISPIINILRSELFPTSVRSVVVPILYTNFFIGAFISMQVFPFITRDLESYVAFWLFSGCNFVLISIVTLLPETRGKTLEEITQEQQKRGTFCVCGKA